MLILKPIISEISSLQSESYETLFSQVKNRFHINSLWILRKEDEISFLIIKINIHSSFKEHAISYYGIL